MSLLLGIIHLIIIRIDGGLLSKEACAVVILIAWWQASAGGFLVVLEFRELLVITVLIVIIRISHLTPILHLPIGGGLFPCRIVTTLVLLVHVGLHLILTMVLLVVLTMCISGVCTAVLASHTIVGCHLILSSTLEVAAAIFTLLP